MADQDSVRSAATHAAGGRHPEGTRFAPTEAEGTPIPPYSAIASSCTLDHEECVVCSDAGIPVRVVTLEGDDALCEDGAGNRAMIAVELVAPVNVGDVLLTHGGVAIGVMGEIRQ